MVLLVIFKLIIYFQKRKAVQILKVTYKSYVHNVTTKNEITSNTIGVINYENRESNNVIHRRSDKRKY